MAPPFDCASPKVREIAASDAVQDAQPPTAPAAISRHHFHLPDIDAFHASLHCFRRLRLFRRDAPVARLRITRQASNRMEASSQIFRPLIGRRRQAHLDPFNDIGRCRLHCVRINSDSAQDDIDASNDQAARGHSVAVPQRNHRLFADDAYAQESGTPPQSRRIAATPRTINGPTPRTSARIWCWSVDFLWQHAFWSGVGQISCRNPYAFFGHDRDSVIQKSQCCDND